MQGWSASSRIGLAVACCAVFAAVVLWSAPGSPVEATEPAPLALPAAIASAPRPQAAMPLEATREAPAPLPPAPTLDGEDLAALERQAMPLEETTAEENEQRGDAIRRLGASSNPDAVRSLEYALRNDVDIRNRILAIDGLRRAALAGNPDQAIVDALLEASRSGDEVIASQASQALAEIKKSRPS